MNLFRSTERLRAAVQTVQLYNSTTVQTVQHVYTISLSTVCCRLLLLPVASLPITRLCRRRAGTQLGRAVLRLDVKVVVTRCHVTVTSSVTSTIFIAR